MKMRWFFMFLFCGLFPDSIAQTDTGSLQDYTLPAVGDRPPRAVYFQGGGAGFFLSVMYDRRFGKRPNGPGLGLGIGYFSGGGASATTFPVAINYLIGKRPHFLESGGGATFATGRIDFADIDVSGDFFFYHLNAGYRYQPSGGFFLRAGISPLFFTGSRDMTSYYLGLGYSF